VEDQQESPPHIPGFWAGSSLTEETKKILAALHQKGPPPDQTSETDDSFFQPIPFQCESAALFRKGSRWIDVPAG
jgi:hypothetical protein